MSADVLVIGGGPVGLVAALHARRRGLRVEVVEPRAQPVDKACGEGIMPAGIAHLAGLDVDPPGRCIRGIRYLSAERSVHAAFTDGPGRGVRRTVLQDTLSDALQAAGVSVTRAAATAITQTSTGAAVLLSDGSARHASYVVGADGLHSAVRRLCGLSECSPPSVRRHGLRRHFAVEPWSDHVEVYWAADAEAYVTPLSGRLVGIAVLTGRTGSLDEHLRAFPDLLARLGGAEPASRATGAGPFRQRTTARTCGRVALVGDAAGYVDAITGEGLSLGWRQAEAALDAIAAGTLASYEGEWRRCTRRSTMLTSGLLAIARHPATRRMIVPTAARVPKVFGSLVDLAARG